MNELPYQIEADEIFTYSVKLGMTHAEAKQACSERLQIIWGENINDAPFYCMLVLTECFRMCDNYYKNRH